VFAVFYALLSIIDLPLGGFIMRSMRCENLPNAWTNTSNWHKGNMFQRTFFCSWKCGKGFAPSSLYPVCLRQSKDEPIFAPHQVIYNTYMNSDYLTTTFDKLFYSHSPDYKYFTTMSDEQKNKLWGDVYNARNAYNTSCIQGIPGVSVGYKDYDPLIRQMCDYYGSDASADVDATTRLTMLEMCQSMYCEGGDTENKPSYCNKQKNADDLLSGMTESKDLVKIIIISSIIILVLGIAMTFLIKSTDLQGNTPNSYFTNTYTGFKEGVKALPGQIKENIMAINSKFVPTVPTVPTVPVV
jgi:hypothetical protein